MKWRLSNNILLLLWVGLMASSFVISADLIPYANSIASTGLRFMLASILMLPLILINYQPVAARKIYLQYGLISLFLVMFFLGLFEALKTTTAMRTSVIYTLVPLISIVLTYFGLKVKTSKIKLLGFALGPIQLTSALLPRLSNRAKQPLLIYRRLRRLVISLPLALIRLVRWRCIRIRKIYAQI